MLTLLFRVNPSPSGTMASLSDTAPSLSIDTDALKEWGYVWRAGTKKRPKKKRKEELEEEMGDDLDESDDESDSDEAPVVVAAPDIVEPSSIGMPEELQSKFEASKKFSFAFSKKQGMEFGGIFDDAVGEALSVMLGGIQVHAFKGNKRASALLPKHLDCVEVGPVRVVGGVRPQNFDVAYRPDGIRIAFDSKTLNDASSIRKNWQNMVNDLGTEATTVHTRFPYAIVAFMVVVPKPALMPNQQADMIRTLERLGSRRHVLDQAHLAESIALVVWNPETGEIDSSVPPSGSSLRIEGFMDRIYEAYRERYKGLPPHDK